MVCSGVVQDSETRVNPALSSSSISGRHYSSAFFKYQHFFVLKNIASFHTWNCMEAQSKILEGREGWKEVRRIHSTSWGLQNLEMQHCGSYLLYSWVDLMRGIPGSVFDAPKTDG